MTKFENKDIYKNIKYVNIENAYRFFLQYMPN